MAEEKTLNVTKRDLVNLCLQVWNIRKSEISEENLRQYFTNMVNLFAAHCGWEEE